MALSKFCDFKQNENKISCKNFKVLENVIVILIIIVTTILLVPKNIDAKLCRDVDIRNTVDNLKKIENCTVIMGFLQIILIENAKPSDFENYSFPKLREITGYFLMFRVVGIKSLKPLFPNLAVIRGLRLMAGYGFIIYENDDLETIELKSLVKIQRGHIRIGKNRNLCNLDYINWDLLTNHSNANVIESDPFVSCPSPTSTCRGCPMKHCWSKYNCQRNHTGFDLSGRFKCHELCLGGCTNTSNTGCVACLGLTENGTCVENCTPPNIPNMENLRCVTPRWCNSQKKKIHNDTCLDECPPNFTVIDYEHDEETIMTCRPCKNNCEKVCPGTEINYMDDAQRLKGCTIISGSLHIKMNIDIADLLTELEQYVGDIEEITGFLKIYRSMAITSLSFLRSLITIGGDELEYGKFGFVIYENANLQTLWDWNKKPFFTIQRGGMFFHYNHKLCLSEVYKFQSITSYDNTTDAVCHESNGYKHSCNTAPMKSKIQVHTAHNVTVFWKEYNISIPNALLGYLVSYIESPGFEITPQYGRDTCSKHSWKTTLISVENLMMVDNYLAYNITHLKPFTQYAFYVKTFTAEDTYQQILDGQTPVRYFKTLLGIPGMPDVTTLSKSHNSITIGWSIADKEAVMITNFKVAIFLRPDDVDFLDNGRDFCLDPRSNETTPEPQYSLTPETCCYRTPNYNNFGEDGYIPECSDENSNEPGCRTNRYNSYMNTVSSSEYSDSSQYPNIYPNNLEYEFRRSLFEVADIQNDNSFPANLENHIGTYRLDAKCRNYTFTNLKPFSLYTMFIVACFNESCSPYSVLSVRTQLLESADDITFTITNTTTEFILHFEPPTQPNGLTVAFHVEAMQLDDNPKSGTLCVTRKEHAQKNNNFVFKDLPYGNYGVRVRSISLAGDGRFTEWKIFQMMEPTPDHTIKNVIITSVILFAFVLLSYGFCKFYKKRQTALAATDRQALVISEYNPNLDEIVWRTNDGQLIGDPSISND